MARQKEKSDTKGKAGEKKLSVKKQSIKDLDASKGKGKVGYRRAI
jgi:hypothetical protein